MKDLNNVFQTSKKELAKTKGDIHEYLGLTIDFSSKYNPDEPNKTDQVVFTMFDYIENIIASAPPDMRSIAPDPTKSKLFNLHKTLPRLNSLVAYSRGTGFPRIGGKFSIFQKTREFPVNSPFLFPVPVFPCSPI